MKLKRGIKSLCILFVTLFMFTGCDLHAIAMVANALGDMDLSNINAIKVVNATGENITLKYEENPDSTTDGYTPRHGEIVLKAGASQENALTGGSYKLTINGIQVFPSYIDSSEYVQGYYTIGGYSTLTIRKDGLLYIYDNNSNLN